MDRQRAAYLDALGVERWRLRADRPATRAPVEPVEGSAPTPEPAPAPGFAPTPEREPPQQPAHAPLAVEGLDWSALEAAVAGCTRCGLACRRTRTVFGVGDRNAAWLVVGEAPGAEEDRRGEPFVGRAGQLLNAMLAAVGLAREQVYIANVLKCRPPDNRDPTPEESASCWPYLERQIALLAPRLILCVGRVAAQSLLGNTTPLGRLRGQPWRYGPAGIPLVVTYHPAYLLRSPAEKRKAWEDLLLARELAREAHA